jgi:hypothetical protein
MVAATSIIYLSSEESVGQGRRAIRCPGHAATMVTMRWSSQMGALCSACYVRSLPASLRSSRRVQRLRRGPVPTLQHLPPPSSSSSWRDEHLCSASVPHVRRHIWTKPELLERASSSPLHPRDAPRHRAPARVVASELQDSGQLIPRPSSSLHPVRL